MKINDENVVGHTHDEVVAIIKKSLDLNMVLRRPNAHVDMVMRRDSNAVHNAVTLPAGRESRVMVTLTRSSLNESYGFSLGTTVSKELVIHTINPGSPAEGKLMQQDVVQTINGKDATKLNHQQVVITLF